MSLANDIVKETICFRIVYATTNSSSLQTIKWSKVVQKSVFSKMNSKDKNYYKILRINQPFEHMAIAPRNWLFMGWSSASSINL